MSWWIYPLYGFLGMCIGALIVVSLLAIAFIMKDLKDFMEPPPFDKEPGGSFHRRVSH